MSGFDKKGANASGDHNMTTIEKKGQKVNEPSLCGYAKKNDRL
jgi:hypothetical protein